jgi:hypothetical protein
MVPLHAESCNAMSTCVQSLTVQPEVVAELRLGLLDEYLRSTIEELNAVTDEVENDLAAPEPNLHGKRERIQAVTRAVQNRHVLHEKVGFAGQPLAEQTLEGCDACALAIGVLTTQRESHIARLARREVPDSERPKIIATVSLLTAFLRYARGETPQPPRDMGPHEAPEV